MTASHVPARTFTSAEGETWTATVESREGPNYKGRFHLVFRAESASEGFPLLDVRWNSHHTAQRTLETMSDFELRRRLRSARRRSA